jgi:hypothetical protein
MASLIGQNIGGNPRGILNLGATINSPLSTTLQSVTDGMGNNSPLQLSTTMIAVGGNTTGSGESGLKLGSINANFGGIWYSGVTPASNNYGLSIGVNYTELRGILGLYFVANYNTIGNVSNTGLALGQGVTAASARLHVRGDGTNPIVRFETGAGTQAFAINNNGGITIARDGNIGPQIYPFNLLETSQDILGFGLGFTSNKVNFVSNNYDVFFNGQNYTATSGVANYVTIRRTFAAAAGAASFRPLNLEYTINNSGAQTGTATGIFLNATQTALNGMGHNLMDLQVGGVSKFKVDNTGFLTTSSAIIVNGYISLPSNASISFSGQSQIFNSSDGVIRLANDAGTSFNRLQFGGTTNAFPAIKRNGADMVFRLADDSGFCNISVAAITTNATANINTARMTNINDQNNFVTAISITASTGKVSLLTLVSATGLPTTRPATVGDLYVDTAANILANGDKIVAIRV